MAWARMLDVALNTADCSDADTMEGSAMFSVDDGLR